MMKSIEKEDFTEFIKKNIPKDSTVALDYRKISCTIFEKLKRELSCYRIVETKTEEFMGSGNADDCSGGRYISLIHELKYAGKSPLQKLQDIKSYLAKTTKMTTGYAALVISKLDEIAWLTNLRGIFTDFPHSPLFYSYAIVLLHMDGNNDNIVLYTKQSDINANYLQENRIIVKPYEQFETDMKTFPSLLLIYTAAKDHHNPLQIFINKKSTSFHIWDSFASKCCQPIDSDVIEQLKAIKNPTELNGFRECHIRDGSAIVRYFAWLEDQIICKQTSISEFEGAQKLLQFRKANHLFISESFETISASGENSAIVHYKPQKDSSCLIDMNKIYLLDSGGQDGTTDTTRTTHFSQPSEYEREMYSRVLMGNLSIEQISFSSDNKITGGHIDSIARQYLWQAGEDYGHGTGHGVGHFLNVHEGPHALSPRSAVCLKKDMVVTNEPGFYMKGQFGIRIENLLIVRSHPSRSSHLAFENVTCVNYEPKLINKELFSPFMIRRINDYHRTIYKVLEPVLREKKDYLALRYLENKTRPI